MTQIGLFLFLIVLPKVAKASTVVSSPTKVTVACCNKCRQCKQSIKKELLFQPWRDHWMQAVYYPIRTPDVTSGQGIIDKTSRRLSFGIISQYSVESVWLVLQILYFNFKLLTSHIDKY
jgi:hypothetical protein